MRTTLAVVTVLAAAIALGRPGAQAQAQAQFHSGTELVSVYTTVQEKNGRLVPDLRQEDFSVTDDGKEQPITFFSNEISPFSVVVLLDRSGSMIQHLPVIRDAAAAFVDQMLPDDKARIGSIGTRITIAPAEFTSNHDVLRTVIGQSLGGGSSPVWLSVDQSITALYGQSGRRVILILSDGHDEPSGNHPRTPFKQVAERIQRAGVMVYAVGFSAMDMRDGNRRIEHADKKLRELADISGGGYFELIDTADLKRLFTRVAEELHRQYWLGFEPKKRDGKLHEIRVKVKRPGMIARARQSYLAPAK
jgi:Ca-activated chloride channel family protein